MPVIDTMCHNAVSTDEYYSMRHDHTQSDRLRAIVVGTLRVALARTLTHISTLLSPRQRAPGFKNIILVECV